MRRADVQRILQISSSFSYEQNPAATTCADKIGRMWVNGRGAARDTFRVTMNNFLATGGDGFTVFNEGTNALGGAQDIDALVADFAAAEPGGIAVPPLNRIVAVRSAAVVHVRRVPTPRRHPTMP